MTALLVVLTFIVFILIDYFYGEKPVVQAVAERRPAAVPAAPRVEPSMVGGFRVPEAVRFHPGHTWALKEGGNMVCIGIDDFAGKLAGRLDKIALPQRGQWIRQGQKVWTLQRDGASVDMVSPVEGTVTDINEQVLRDPELARRDPYGEGWLVRVESPDSKLNFRNLLGGTLARWWTEESAARLMRLSPGALGALAQDGGVAMDNLTTAMPDAEWTAVTREFFLT